jgi:hypothetical protein
MRYSILTILTLGAASIFVSPIVSAQAQVSTFCDSDNRCINASAQAYNACYTLAKQRGWTDMQIDYRGRTQFIYSCLRGRVR